MPQIIWRILGLLIRKLTCFVLKQYILLKLALVLIKKLLILTVLEIINTIFILNQIKKRVKFNLCLTVNIEVTEIKTNKSYDVLFFSIV